MVLLSRRLRRIVPAAFVLQLALAGAAAGPAHADLKSGKSKLVHGDYEAAITELEAVGGKSRHEAQILKARALLQIGKFELAERAAKKVGASRGAVAIEGQVLHAEILQVLGKYDEAKRILEPIVAREKKQLGARVLLASVYRDIGQKERAEKTINTIYDDYKARRINEKDPQELFALAQAGRYLESYQFANGFFSDAVDLDRNLHAANIEWGHMLLHKYNAADAERSFDEVLKTDPNYPDAHAGMARVKLEKNYDLQAATFHIERALEVNPRHVPSLQIRAELETDKNQWTEAKKTINEILAINPKHAGAHAQLATIHWLKGETAEYEKHKRAALAVNPQFAELFHIVARSAVREHRYKEAIELEKEALALDSSYYAAMQEVGTGYLRLGQEKEGLEWLRKAYAKDSYNVRTVNLLDLFEKVIPKSYKFTQSTNFRIRLHDDESAVYQRFIGPLLETAFVGMVKRYQFKPVTPVILELYQDPDHYSVRTVGLPNLGALGVCFGQVITARSPSGGDMNWAMVLWHELAHVFAIQLSNSRVPRWYTEGLSEYETMVARPEWRRENDADVYGAVLAGELPSVSELNYGFMKPDMQQVVVAYYLSAITMEYIVDNFGFDNVVLGLKLFGQGLETPEVIQKITGRSVAQFDREFRAYLDLRLAPYKGTFRLPSSGFDDIKALKAATTAKPKSASAWAELALGYFFDGNGKGSQVAVDKALALDAKNKIALYIGGELALHKRDLKGAQKHYHALIAAGGDGAEVRGRLGTIAAASNRDKEAEKHFCTAKKLDPERSFPFQSLSELYEKQGKTKQALAELEQYVYIEQMQYSPVKKLVDEYSKLKNWAKVRSYGELAIEINPADPDLLLKLARALIETGDAKRAIYIYDSALMIKPAIRRPALAHIGRAKAYRALKQTGNAQKALAKALKLEPNNDEALRLKAKLR